MAAKNQQNSQNDTAVLKLSNMWVQLISTVTSSIPGKSLLSAGRKRAALTIDLMERRKSSGEYLNLDVVVTHYFNRVPVCGFVMQKNEKIITRWSRFKPGQDSERGCLVWPSPSTCAGSFIVDQQLKPTCSSGWWNLKTASSKCVDSTLSKERGRPKELPCATACDI